MSWTWQQVNLDVYEENLMGYGLECHLHSACHSVLAVC